MESEDEMNFGKQFPQTNRTHKLSESDVETYYLFDQLPVGVLIFELRCGNDIRFKLKYSNAVSSKILDIFPNDSTDTIIKKLDAFKEWSNVQCEHGADGRSLHDFLLEDADEEYTSNKFINGSYLIYTKIKRTDGYLIVTIDSYDDERKVIQSNIIRNTGNQYMLTLFHEINNPLSCLVTSVDELVEQKNKNDEVIVNRIHLMEHFIKIFIKNFILLFKMSFEKIDSGMIVCSNVNLSYTMNRVLAKYSNTFNHKRINVSTLLSVLENKFISTEYFYFKALVKNIFILFYHKIKHDGQLQVEATFQSLSNLSISFKSSDCLVNDHPDLNTSFLHHTDITNSIQTIEITKDIIRKASNLLDIKATFYEVKNYLHVQLSMNCKSEELNDGDDISEYGHMPELVQSKHIEGHPKKLISSLKKVTNGAKQNEIVRKDFYSQSKRNRLRFDRTGYKNCPKKVFSTKGFFIRDDQQVRSAKSEKKRTILGEFRHRYRSSSGVGVNTSIAGRYQTLKEQIKRYELSNSSLFSDNIQPTQVIKCKSKFALDNTNNEENLISNNFYFQKHNNLRKHHLQETVDNPINNNKCVEVENNYTDIPNGTCSCNDILIVDDEVFNISAMRYIFEKKNDLRVDIAMNGEECLKLIHKKQGGECKNCTKKNYKLIFMDIMMPLKDGIETSKNIQTLVEQKVIKQEPIICIVSAQKHDQIQSVIKTLKPVKEFLVKPVKKEKVFKILQRYYYRSKC